MSEHIAHAIFALRASNIAIVDGDIMGNWSERAPPCAQFAVNLRVLSLRSVGEVIYAH